MVTVNGKPANINTPLEPNCEITITESTEGGKAIYTIGQLEEYGSSTISFTVNGKNITCPKYTQVNGSLEPASYEIKEGDIIESRAYYTVSQVAEFMDVTIDDNQTIMVNNREATLDTLVYENFTIEWGMVAFSLASHSDVPYNATEDTGDADLEHEELQEDMDTISPEEKSDVPVDATPAESPGTTLHIWVNDDVITLEGKPEYIFVDIFDFIQFDLGAGNGRSIVTKLNGRDAQYTEALHEGDKIKIYWEES